MQDCRLWLIEFITRLFFKGKDYMISQELVDSVKQGEGLRLYPYKCTAGKLSIGYGRNLDDCGITEEEAECLLQHDLETALSEVEKLDWFQTLNNPRRDVIVEMCFNLGLPKLLKFTKMIKAIKEYNYTEAAKQMLDSNWATQVKGRADRLANRMEKGIYD